MSDFAKVILFRFIRGGIAGAVSTAATVTVFTGVTTWTQFQMALSALGLCLCIGFITGSIMAVDKYLRVTPDSQ